MLDKQGKFIVFEGIDGCGKSTQAELFARRLYNHNKFNHVLLTREPYNSKEIRKRFVNETNPYENPELMAALFIGDRYEHMCKLIIPNVKTGVHVVSDRYKLSTIAYQTTQGLDMSNLIDRHKFFIVPDLTLFVELPVEVAAERMAKEQTGREKKFEANLEFQEKLGENYHLAIQRLMDKERIWIIYGNRTKEEIAEQIWHIAEPLFARV